jgi:hypothetical protein
MGEGTHLQNLKDGIDRDAVIGLLGVGYDIIRNTRSRPAWIITSEAIISRDCCRVRETSKITKIALADVA